MRGALKDCRPPRFLSQTGSQRDDFVNLKGAKGVIRGTEEGVACDAVDIRWLFREIGDYWIALEGWGVCLDEIEDRLRR